MDTDMSPVPCLIVRTYNTYSIHVEDDIVGKLVFKF